MTVQQWLTMEDVLFWLSNGTDIVWISREKNILYSFAT